MKNLRVSEEFRGLSSRTLALMITSTLSIGLTACGDETKRQERKFAKIVTELPKNAKYGKLNQDGKNSDFTIVEVGSYQDGLTKEEEELLEDGTLPISILITSYAKSLGEIYLELDYAKEIIQEYSIAGGVILDIDSLLSCNTTEEVNLFVTAFLEKANANSIYGSILGTTRNLNRLESFFYPTILRCEKEDIEIDADRYAMLFLDDFACAFDYDYEYSSDEASFLEDAIHVVQPGEYLEKIASQYRISVDDLCIYNGILDADKIYPNQILRIPNHYEQEVETIEESSDIDWEKYVLGIDVSSYQGKIDWKKVATKPISFALIRVGYKNRIDTSFRENLEGCSRYRIPKGLYFYSKANTKEEALVEAKLVLDQLTDEDTIELPIYLDFEQEEREEKDNRLDRLARGTEQERKEMNDVIRTFLEAIEKAGYEAGIYIHKNYVSSLASDILAKYTVWACGGTKYNTPMTLDSLQFSESLEEPVMAFQFTQYGNAKDYGITENLYVDINVMNKEYYESLIEKEKTKKKDN